MAAAERILRAEGIGAVTTRRVAGELGVTPMALYRHFQGKEALVQALVEAGFNRWEKRLARAVKTQAPRRRMENAVRAYREFALAEPRLFELMFLVPRPGAPAAPASLRTSPSPAFSRVIAAVEEGMRAGELPGSDPEQLILMIWSLAHGLVALHFAGRFRFDAPLFRRTYDRTMSLLWSRL